MAKVKEDPTYRERFGISTPIKYVPNVIVEPKWQKTYENAWKRFKSKHKNEGSIWRRKRFDAFLKRIEKLGDDLPYTKRVAIRFINKDVGFGVFAKEDIPPYSILNLYGGYLRPEKAIALDNDSTFMVSDFKSFSLDAMKQGNWCRFMNHAPEDSERLNVLSWEHYSKWGPRIIFTASSHGIKKGEQLLYSYGDVYWEEGKDAFDDL